MTEPLKQQPFRVLEGSREKLLGRRRVVPAWQSETAAESELRELRQVSMPRQVELPGVQSSVEAAKMEPALPAGETGIEMATKKKRKAVKRLSAVQIGELQRRSLTDESAADLMREFGISRTSFYKHAKAAKKLAAKAEKTAAKKTAARGVPARPEKEASGPPAAAELMGLLEALARFVDARVDRRLAEAFGRLGGK